MVKILSKISYVSNVSITFFCVDKYGVAVHICSKGRCNDDDDVVHLIMGQLLLASVGPCPCTLDHVPCTHKF